MIKLEYLREFIVLADTLSFARTAELTYVTQPALTRHIAALEEDLGGKLFERTTRSVSLTPAGKAAYEPLKKVAYGYAAVQQQTSALSSGLQGTLSISSPYYWTEDFTEPVVEHFKKSNPKTSIRIFSCQAAEGLHDIMAGRSDLFLYLRLKNVDPSIRYIPYKKEQFSVCCLKDHPLAQYSSLKLEQIAGNQIISFPFPEGENNPLDFGSYNNFLFEILSRRNIYPDKFLLTQQIDTVGLSLRENSGVCILPYGIRHMDRSYLCFIPLEDEDCVMDMCFYYQMSNNNPVIPQFIRSATTIAKQTVHPETLK